MSKFLELIGPFGLMAITLSTILGVLSFFYAGKTLVKKKVAIKTMQDSLGESAQDTQIIMMVSLVLCLLGMGFFAVCVGIIFFTYGAP